MSERKTQETYACTCNALPIQIPCPAVEHDAVREAAESMGPWGFENGYAMFAVCDSSGAQVCSAADALAEYIAHFDDWQEYALSVAGPLMYHHMYDFDESIQPCECDDDHDGQVEVWKVVAQDQAPTARHKGYAQAEQDIAEWLRFHRNESGGRSLICNDFAVAITNGEHRTKETL